MIIVNIYFFDLRDLDLDLDLDFLLELELDLLRFDLLEERF
jgi:hypothetical protein